MSDATSKAKDVKTKARVADKPPISAQAWKRVKMKKMKRKDDMLLSITSLSI